MNEKKLERLKANPVMIRRAELISELLSTIPKENINREGLIETPWRVAKMMDELFSGYKENGKQILEDAMFTDSSQNLVLVRDIPFYSACEHHCATFFGTVTIAYIPQDGRIVGLSKLARLVEVYARRLQVQERLGEQIAEDIKEVMNPFGLAVIIKGRHMCMESRGVQKPGAETITSFLDGVFKLDEKARQELMSLITWPKTL